MSRRILDIALAALIVGAMVLGGALYLRWRDKQVGKRAIDKKEIAALDSTREVQRDSVIVRDSIRYRDVTRYHDISGRIVAANPQNIPARQIKDVADKAIASDSGAILSRDTLLETQSREIARLQAMKLGGPPRVSLYGSGGYDFIQKEPTSKIGSEIRIFEPLSVNGYLEARTRMERDSSGARVPRVRFSGVVEARITFR